jgi:hypothetical protein
MRKISCARYHYAVRFIKRHSAEISSAKLAESMIVNKDTDFWAEVRKIKGVKAQLPNSIDGKTEEAEICELFSHKYETLLNSVSYNTDDMNSILKSIDCDIDQSCNKDRCYSKHNINVNDLMEAVKELKPHKTDGNDGCQSNHLIHGTQRLYVLLSQLFTCMLKHGYAPDSFLLSTITSIPKNKRKSLNDSSNYRGIALSSILGKVLDWVVLNQNKKTLRTCDLQFGFKAKHSTSLCTFVIDEVMQHYLNNGSNTYIMLLDASQAFDRVNYCKLFKLLLKKGLCPLICRFLAYSYTKQCVRAKWGNALGDPFSVSNGVKQGGVLSPILFTLYMDEIIGRLEETGVGCHIGKKFVGAPGYADDLTLLAPTKYAIKTLLKASKEFSDNYDVKFNASKFQFVALGPSGPVNDSICIDGNV